MYKRQVDKLRDPEVVVFNRCTAATDKSYLHKAVRMVNRRAQIIFEHTDGSIEPDETQDELPFDLTQDEIVIGDEDFGIWFLDAMDDPEKYEGKTLAFKAYVCQLCITDRWRGPCPGPTGTAAPATPCTAFCPGAR